MKHAIIDETLERHRYRLAAVLDDLVQLAGQLGAAELGQLVRDSRHHLDAPFLFVVVGEIKAGKSSFINALLSADVCPVDPAPCTDTVQEIGWAPEPVEHHLSPHLKRIGRPVEILKSIAVVDTPGTNTLVTHHQEITQRFIPNSGLVLFVFPAKNPYTRSAWELLSFIRADWRKRVVFILQQADLATETELRVNTAGLEETARGHDIAQPLVFATSARWEAQQDPRSGFDAVRDFIRQTVTGGRHTRLKLQTATETAQQLLARAMRALEDDRRQLTGEQETAGQIHRQVADHRRRAGEHLEGLATRLVAVYDQAADRFRRNFEGELQTLPLLRRSMGMLWRREASLQAWIEGLQHGFGEDLRTQVTDTLSQELGPLLENLRDAVGRLLRELERHPSGLDAAAAGEGIDPVSRREEVVAEIRRRLDRIMADNRLAGDLAPGAGKMSSTLISGGALTLVGGILLLTTHIGFLDITGGVLTGAGLLMAGGVLSVRRRKVLAALDQGLDQGRRALMEETEQLPERMLAVFAEIERGFAPYHRYVSDRKKRLEHMAELALRIQRELDLLDGELSG